MNVHVLMAQASAGGQIEQIARTFGVDWPQLISQIISFSIVCVLLQRFAYRPILAMLEQRRQQIAESVAYAERIKAELAKTETQRQQLLVQVNAEAAKLIEEARAAAAVIQHRETQRAIAAAEQIMLKAHEAAALDRDRMLAELKREVGRLVVQTTAAVAGKILTPEDQRHLAEDTARQLVVNSSRGM